MWTTLLGVCPRLLGLLVPCPSFGWIQAIVPCSSLMVERWGREFVLVIFDVFLALFKFCLPICAGAYFFCSELTWLQFVAARRLFFWTSVQSAMSLFLASV